MEHVYAALTLLSLGRPLTREGLAAIVAAAGGTPSPAMIEALLHLAGVLGGAGAGPADEEPAAVAGAGGGPPPEPGRGVAPAGGGAVEEGGGEGARSAAGAADEARSAAGAGGAEEARSAAPVALYLYGVVPWEGEGEARLEVSGAGGAEVYAVGEGGFAALVHHWPAGATLPEGEEALRAWAEAHLAVLEEARRRFGTVLPVAVGRLVGREGEDPRTVVRRWLREQAASLGERCRRLTGKEEYGLQVLWDPERWAARLAGQSPELRRLREEIGAAAGGQAYLLRERFGRVLRAELEARAAEVRQAVLGLVRERSADFRVEKLREGPEGRAMLLNLAVLVSPEQLAPLGEGLEEIKGDREGLEIRLTGPWPPYSFAA